VTPDPSPRPRADGIVNTEDLEIAERFCGPPNSGNGGYVCGRIAKNLSGTVSVCLKR